MDAEWKLGRGHFSSTHNIMQTTPLTELTKTVAQTLELDISDELREELQKQQPDWLVVVTPTRLFVAPPQEHVNGRGWIIVA